MRRRLLLLACALLPAFAVVQTAYCQTGLSITDSIPIAVYVGFDQMALNTSTDVLYFAASADSVGAYNPTTKKVATITVGSNKGGQLYLAVDPTRNYVWVTDGANVYVVDAANGNSVTPPLKTGNSEATVIALDMGSNRFYMAGTNTFTTSVVLGPTAPTKAPTLVATISSGEGLAASMGVDPLSGNVYGVCSANCPGLASNSEEGFININGMNDTSTMTVFPADEDILSPDFIPESLTIDAKTGTPIVAGAASLDTEFGQTSYSVYLIESVHGDNQIPQVSFSFPPLIAVADSTNRIFYTSDSYYGKYANSSNVQLVTGLDSLSLAGTPITLFSSATPTNPYVFDVEPDPSVKQAYISTSSTQDGGKLQLYDVTAKKVIATGAVSNNGGGYLAVDSNTHTVYMADVTNSAIEVFNGSSATNATQTVLTISPDPVSEGQQVTLTATVTSPSQDPPSAGSVNFVVGTLVVGNASVNSQGLASLTRSTSGLPPGTYNVKAVYLGDQSYASSTSVAVTETIEGTKLVLNASAPIVQGQKATVSGTVTAVGGGSMPTGTVTFAVGGNSLGKASLQSGVATLPPFTVPTNVPAGAYKLSAVYAGNDPASSATETVQLLNAVKLAISLNPNVLVSGQSVTATFTVSRFYATGAPSGTITVSFDGFQFFSGPLVAGSVSTTQQLPQLPAGTYPVVIDYAPTSLDAPLSESFNVTVQ